LAVVAVVAVVGAVGAAGGVRGCVVGDVVCADATPALAIKAAAAVRTMGLFMGQLLYRDAAEQCRSPSVCCLGHRMAPATGMPRS
jgi:hypothetical protein